jgi:hypothetical protein
MRKDDELRAMKRTLEDYEQNILRVQTIYEDKLKEVINERDLCLITLQ